MAEKLADRQKGEGEEQSTNAFTASRRKQIESAVCNQGEEKMELQGTCRSHKGLGFSRARYGDSSNTTFSPQARKALGALKGLVKLQALVRGHLVRKQANATLRCMHALINAQERARTQRIRMVEESQYRSQQQLSYRRSLHHPRLRRSFENDRNEDENVKIVEMDLGVSRSNSKCRNSYSMTTPEYKTNLLLQFSPAPSALTEVSPRVLSGHFEEFSFTTAQSSPHLSAMSMPTAMHNSFDYPLYPNYMANTESSRAKVRSQSAPRQRLDAYERQSSKRRLSVEGRNIPKGIRMQRSSSHVGLTANSYQYPWSIKLDKSNMSVKESECDSTSTILTNTNYCRSLLGYEVKKELLIAHKITSLVKTEVAPEAIILLVDSNKD
ncbi:Protein IQ-domain 31 [Apostasia shenzhenica]|uniref:Protein IQ-domain 31 n=1 Tax=Apostasia shenzhenica TaxID=1088818 RepID=A0A2I0A1G2_9ASPA|nr:Protein IQ-domain 31 [Apostasia shenzhenica]